MRERVLAFIPYIFGNFLATNYQAEICIVIHLPKAATNSTEYAIRVICIKHFSLKALQMHKSSSSSAFSQSSLSIYTAYASYAASIASFQSLLVVVAVVELESSIKN